MRGCTEVGVYGITGYTGMELLKLLEMHPSMKLTAAQSRERKWNNVGELHPAIRRSASVPIRESIDDPPELVFLCLPAGEAMKIGPALLSAGCRVVDLSPDYRLNAQQYSSTYGMEHLDAAGLQYAAYGLTELNRGKVEEASIVANPGCYATAALLALAPLAPKLKGTVIIDAKSGTSGSGKDATPFNHHSEVAENIKPYSINKHRHIPEISGYLSSLGSDPELIFVPHLVPIVRGLMATIYLPQMPAELALQMLTKMYRESMFVHVVRNAALKHVVGTNQCLIQVEKAGEGCILISCIDNLLKGASGQALQNANVMVGLPEESGLILPGTGTGI